MRTMWLPTAGLVVLAALTPSVSDNPMLTTPVTPVASPTGWSSCVTDDPNDPPIGQEVWAMALMISDRGPDDPALDRESTLHGYRHVVFVGCDLGAREGLGLRQDKDYWYNVIYFETQRDAFDYKNRNGLSVVGIVAVTPTDCQHVDY